LGKLQIPKASEEFEDKSEEGRRMMINANLIELSFTESILSIDISNSFGKKCIWNSKRLQETRLPSSFGGDDSGNGNKMLSKGSLKCMVQTNKFFVVLQNKKHLYRTYG
jgi:hypothetical protein